MIQKKREAERAARQELIVVSYGCSFPEARQEEIEPVEEALKRRYPERSFRRAYTSSFIIKKLEETEGLHFDRPEAALQAAVEAGATDVLVQPTHVIAGFQYQMVVRAVEKFQEKFERITLGQPLLGRPTEDGQPLSPELLQAAQIIAETSQRRAGYSSPQAAAEAGLAIALMGHGTEHKAHRSYAQLQQALCELGYQNLFVGTVAEDQEALLALLRRIQSQGYRRLELQPLMLVAGDHAHNDMAGLEEDSWLSIARASELFTEVVGRPLGFGREREIQEEYIRRAEAAAVIH